MDHRVFPIGTQFWKEFSLTGCCSRPAWSSGTAPARTTTGWARSSGTPTRPKPTSRRTGSRTSAGRCTTRRRRKTAVMATAATSAAGSGSPPSSCRLRRQQPTLQSLNAEGLLTAPPAAGGYPLGADPATTAALGYLHANCGHCHNQNGTAWPDTQMVLRSVVADTGVDTSAVYRSMVNVPLQYWRGGAITLRVAPGQPDQSAIVARMSVRGNDDQMPPLATELVDSTGLDTIRQWIQPSRLERAALRGDQPGDCTAEQRRQRAGGRSRPKLAEPQTAKLGPGARRGSLGLQGAWARSVTGVRRVSPALDRPPKSDLARLPEPTPQYYAGLRECRFRASLACRKIRAARDCRLIQS